MYQKFCYIRSDYTLDTTGVIQLVIILVLVALSAFFSSAETALSTANRVRLKALSDDGNHTAAKVLKILESK